jgi:hypothetical protein
LVLGLGFIAGAQWEEWEWKCVEAGVEVLASGEFLVKMEQGLEKPKTLNRRERERNGKP